MDWLIKANTPFYWLFCWGSLTELEQAHPEPNTLYVQVGDADLDNAYWGGDQGIPGNRTSFPINATQWVMSFFAERQH